MSKEQIKKLFKVHKLIGEGGFGKVYEATFKETNEVVALKCPAHKESLNHNIYEEEIEILKMLNAKNYNGNLFPSLVRVSNSDIL